MKVLIFLLLLTIFYVHSYDRGAVVSYAQTHWNRINHQCGNYLSCTPYSYFGNEACGYPGQGGDCANFVSQCLIAGGHPLLRGHTEWCRGYPCGKEEPGALRLGNCLSQVFRWRKDCGYLMTPPADVRPGDVLIYHEDGCGSYSAHATVVVSANGGDVRIACHSSNQYGTSYTYMGKTKGYYEWLRNPN